VKACTKANTNCMKSGEQSGNSQNRVDE
jgi:hypothetical protein